MKEIMDLLCHKLECRSACKNPLRNVFASSAVHAAFVVSTVSDENKATLYKRAFGMKEAQPLVVSSLSSLFTETGKM